MEGNYFVLDFKFESQYDFYSQSLASIAGVAEMVDARDLKSLGA